MSLIGTLDEIRLADVLRLFAGGRKSGVLTVADGAHQALLRFDKGGLVHATAGRLHGEEAVLDVFGWKRGQLSFVPEERPVAPNLAKDVEVLIAEGLKAGDAFHRIRELVPSDRVVFELAEGPAAGATWPIARAAWELVRLADGVADVGEMVAELGRPRGEVVQQLFELVEAGLLRRVDVVRMLRVAAKGVSARGLLGAEAAEVDERFDDDWRQLRRFENGVLRIEVRTSAGRVAPVGVTFRAGRVREILLPRALAAELGLKDGDEVAVRPIA